VQHQYTLGREKSEWTDTIRREIAQQALLYQEQRDDFVSAYDGQFIALSQGKVTEAHATMATVGQRGGANGHGVFLKQVAPLTHEQEHLALYAPIAHGPAWTTA
jgi:hypothetical protein